jgi:hypothetical protein
LSGAAACAEVELRVASSEAPCLPLAVSMMTLVIGLVLTALSWIAAWGSSGLLSEYSFFPLWLGYILSVNGLAGVLFKTSLLARMGRSFALLFAISIPLWWFFEGMNAIVRNWHYHLARPVTPLHYFIEASIDFSTVVPAVLSTAFLLAASTRFDRILPKWRARVSHRGLALATLAGLGCFAIMALFPEESFPLVWIAPILVLEPLAVAIRYPTLLPDARENGGGLLFAVMAAATVTGICWEMWNYHSLPKWTYTVPYVGFWKIFEMPLLGYLGYPFFGIVVFGYAGIVLRLFGRLDLLELFGRAVIARTRQ